MDPSSVYVGLVVIEGSPVGSTSFPWFSFLGWNNIFQSSGPSLMRHCGGRISEPDIYVREMNVQ